LRRGRPDYQVKSVGHRINRSVGNFQCQPNTAILFGELCCDRANRDLGYGCGAANPQFSAGLALQVCRFAIDLVHFAHECAAMTIYPHTKIRDSKLTGGAIDEGYTELIFQASQTTAKRWAGDIPVFAGARKTARFHDMGEQNQIIDIRHGAGIIPKME
jgi:hypothetical protein